MCALALAFWLDSAAAAGPIAPAELYAALSSAQGGDRIVLAGGYYGALNITGVTFSSDVTIVSADPANPAIVSELLVRNSSHLVFDSILFDYVAQPGDNTFQKPFWIRDSAHIKIRNSVFDGDEVPSSSGSGEFGLGYGLYIVSSEFVVIENNELYDFTRGLVTRVVNNLIIRANDIHSVASDGMNLNSVDTVLVEGNWIHDFKVDPLGGAHADMIQIRTTSGEISSRNVIIRDNFFDAGTGSRTQTIFNGGTSDAFQNILIEDNVIYNAHVHGISLGLTHGLVVRNNTLLWDGFTSSAPSPGTGSPRIIIAESSLNVTVEGNITGDVWNRETMTGQPGWTVGQNLLVQYDGPGRKNYYLKLFTNALGQDPDLSDLRALPGGLIETLGLGAEMTRSDITLDVGPVR